MEKNNIEESSIDERSDEEIQKKPEKKTQAQIIQEALGLEPQDIQEIEKKLFIARFFDFFSQETFEFIYKDRSLETYKREITGALKLLSERDEENKLLYRNLEERNLFEIVEKLKQRAEKLAFSAGIKEPIDKKLRKISLMVMIPMFALVMGLSLIPGISLIILFPVLCIFCTIPQIIRNSIVRKWFDFKQRYKNQFWEENREDILILKSFVGEILDNLRNRLLDLKVPLQLIKFVLHSRDYENLELINQANIRGTNQYFFTFKYPPGVEPFPIPEILRGPSYPQESQLKQKQEMEKNFIVLTEMKGKKGIIESFVPTLKQNLADKINRLLNECEFKKVEKDIKEIIPDYSEQKGIYCVCGELAKINNIQKCNWRNKFKFYLFESESCGCNEVVYALSLMDDSDEVPEELADIFK
ncbi:MAG: hypothetical protein ACTSQP_07245 [Promethearchaeota archaeon]